jgi:MATE family multidrug resistance protein
LQILLDRVLLSRDRSDAVAAALGGGVLIWAPMLLFQYTANYATTFVAQYTGAGQPERVGPVVWQAFYFSAASGLAFLGLIPFAGPLVALTGHSPELQELETAYFGCLCWSVLPTLVTAAATSFFAGRGDSRTVLLVNVVGLVVNGACAYVLIYGKAGFPALGIVGAGWATVAGTSMSAVLAVALMMRRRFRQRYGTWSGRRLDPALFARLMSFGVPNGVFVALDILSFSLFLVAIGRLGPVELAASSIVLTLNLIAFLPPMGVGQAVEVLVGQRLGEDRPDLAERSTYTGCVLALLFTVGVALAYAFLPETLAEPFRSEKDAERWEQVGALIPSLLRFVALYCLFDSLNMTFSFALRGAGDTRFVTWAQLSLSWPVMVLPTWASWYFGWGLFWAWGFASLYIVLLALTFFARFRQGKWRSMRVIGPIPEPADLRADDADSPLVLRALDNGAGES